LKSLPLSLLGFALILLLQALLQTLLAMERVLKLVKLVQFMAQILLQVFEQVQVLGYFIDHLKIDRLGLNSSSP